MNNTLCEKKNVYLGTCIAAAYDSCRYISGFRIRSIRYMQIYYYTSYLSNINIILLIYIYIYRRIAETYSSIYGGADSLVRSA